MFQSITFPQAKSIIHQHGPAFGGKGVVGVGIADRNERLRFVVAVEDAETRDRLARQYADQDVSGYPIHVEVGTVARLSGNVGTARLAMGRDSIVQELVDRPGIIVLAMLLLLSVAAFAALR